MDNGFLLLAARSVRRQAKQLKEQLDGVRTSADVEYVHRARVASRKLRVAFQIFRACFGARKARRWRNEIRRAASELGEARDRDVQAAFLCEMLQKITRAECHPGVARLLVHLDCEREKLHPRVCKAIDRLKASGVIEDILATSHRIVGELDGEEVAFTGDAARSRAGDPILQRLDQMLSLADSLADHEQKTRHHAMRIAAKRLRYTLEFCNPVFDKRLDEAIEASKALQTLLGDLHDCDVWQAKLDDFTEEERDRVAAWFGSDQWFARLQAGIDWLRGERLDRRTAIFHELEACWSELNCRKIWDNLRQIVEIADESSDGVVPMPPTAGEANGKNGRQTFGISDRVAREVFPG